MFVTPHRKTQFPRRILHVVGALNRGGIEAWLMEVLRHLDHDRFHADFLVFGSEPGPYHDEIRRIGSRILICAPPRRPYRFASTFGDVLRASGPYDIVHSHIHFSNGPVLKHAARARVPVRIAHSHMSGEDRRVTPVRLLYRRMMVRWISRYATHGLGCSRLASAALFGSGWDRDSRFQVLHCGIDLAPFERETGKSAKAELGIPQDAMVVGHVGRFVPQKNHRFFIEVAKQLASMNPNVYFLLLGDGPLRSGIETQVAASGLTSRFVFGGVRSDIPRLMISAMDAFVFPSLYEGLPIAGLEAQAAGLPCIFSSSITREVQVLRDSTEFWPLSRSARFWAERILTSTSLRRVLPNEAVRAMKNAGFCYDDSVRSLSRIYDLGK